jgi:isoleucyl-tRNA synthetase
VAAAVNGNLDYVKLQASDGSIYYFAKDNLEFQRLEKQFKEKKQWIDGVPKLKTIAQIFKEHGGYEVLGSIKGSEMVGWKYEGPYDDLPAQQEPGGYPFIDEELKVKNAYAVNQHSVIDPGKDNIGNDIVVAGEGTGIVHMAPGCGDIDHKIGKKLGLVNLAPLDDESKFIDKYGWLEGKTATDPKTTESIIADLKDRGFLVHVEDYPHVYPHCWRSGDELVFRLVEEWYINMDWRGKIKKVVDDINWIPEWGQDREHEWLDNMGDWMISKKRFWGLALPIWTFEDDSFYVVGSKEELKELAVEGWDEFEGNSPHRPWIDKVKIKHPESGLIGQRIVDVGNPWLDAGIVPFSTMGYTTDKDYWKEWFPGDFVTECFPGQFRNWFYSLLAMSAELEETAPFKTLLGHGLVKDETGRDMHKSWGNAIWFDDAAEKMGVDVMRWMYATQNIEHNLLFGYGHADEVRKKLIQLWNSYSFYATYASVDGFSPEGRKLNDNDLTILDKWILSKMHKLIKDATENYNAFRVDKFMRSFERFLDDLSNWYIRRNRRRFWKAEDDADKLTAYQTLYEVLFTTIRLLAPCLPFVSEEIYQNLVRSSIGDAPESIHLCDFPIADEASIDETLMNQVDALRKVVEQSRSARNKANLKIRQPLAKLCFAVEDDDVAAFIEANSKVILDELNVKTLVRVMDISELIQYEVKPNLPFLGEHYGKQMKEIRTAIAEMDVNNIIQTLNSGNGIKFELTRESIELNKDAFLINTKSAEGFTSEMDGGITVGLTTKLTEELLREGMVRDLIRHVQIMRKNANFAVEDRIKINGLIDGPLGDALEDYKEFFCNETLTIEMTGKSNKGEYESTFEIQDQSLTLSIERTHTKKG